MAVIITPRSLRRVPPALKCLVNGLSVDVKSPLLPRKIETSQMRGISETCVQWCTELARHFLSLIRTLEGQWRSKTIPIGISGT